ncbi:MAG: four-carbon acid sugar kinase family protein [Gammaproteobacteria bacterium]|nr:four-carbon acid sugar kinase family protein [Gammaproteobacteria bacterium]MCW9004796.1 four-carbon acid sugar kinase family protein [Gammaproteobacteria bacterium]
MAETKIIVLDDDPTGSQTVHSCLLLTRWDVTTLKEGLQDDSPLFFVLTNTRGMDATSAADLTREVCINLKQALADLKASGRDINPLVVSRSDSTLRGHYPVETDVIAEQLGPFDAHFMVPAFFEGGRFTRDSIHYLMVDGKPVPVHETEFAHDSVFSYNHSYLPDYVEEKTQGRIKAGDVERFQLNDVRGDSLERLMTLKDNHCCVVDAESQDDLNHFCNQLMTAASKGKRFLFRSAASLLTALSQLPAQPISAEKMSRYVRNEKPGAVIVGSHVKKTTQQLNALLQAPGIIGIEVNVDEIQGNYDSLRESISEQINDLHQQSKTVVIYTSRLEKVFASQSERLDFGMLVSDFLMDIVRHLPETLGFLISKGGITSNDVLSKGLSLKTSRVVGQILAGCSVVRCPVYHQRFSDMPVVIFPGNVGDENSLAEAYLRLSAIESVDQAVGKAS